MKQAGFTLIEVLAALLIFSVAIIGLTHAGTESARAVSAIDQKMLAGIVADNQLVLSRQEALKIGVETGEETAMSRTFEYEVETRATDIAGFHEIVVKVKAKDRSQIIIERKAFRMGAT